MTLEAIKSETLKLQTKELLDLIQFGIEVLKKKQLVEVDDCSPAWKAEVQRRGAEIRNGSASVQSWEQVQQELNKEFGFDLTVSQ